MIKTIKECLACHEKFEWNQNVVRINGYDEHYHESCVELYPIGYSIFLDGEYLGDAENPPDWAMSTVNDGEYVDLESEDSQ